MTRLHRYAYAAIGTLAGLLSVVTMGLAYSGRCSWLLPAALWCLCVWAFDGAVRGGRDFYG